MFNKITLIGRLGHDPEARITSAGTVVNFSLATNETWLDNQGQKQTRTEWHRVIVWGKQAELCTEYLAKGRLVFVEGSLQTRKWQDQQGQDRYTTEVKARRVLFLDHKGDGGGEQRAPQEQQSFGMQDDLGPAFPSEASDMDDLPF